MCAGVVTVFAAQLGQRREATTHRRLLGWTPIVEVGFSRALIEESSDFTDTFLSSSKQPPQTGSGGTDLHVLSAPRLLPREGLVDLVPSTHSGPAPSLIPKPGSNTQPHTQAQYSASFTYPGQVCCSMECFLCTSFLYVNTGFSLLSVYVSGWLSALVPPAHWEGHPDVAAMVELLCGGDTKAMAASSGAGTVEEEKEEEEEEEEVTGQRDKNRFEMLLEMDDF